MENVIYKLTAIASSNIVLMARLKKSDNTYVVQADVSSIRIDLYQINDGIRTSVDATNTAITDGSAYASPSVSSVIHDTLQTDSRWTGSSDGDSTGYNLAYEIAAPAMDQTFEVRLTLTLTSGKKEVVVYQIDSK